MSQVHLVEASCRARIVRPALVGYAALLLCTGTAAAQSPRPPGPPASDALVTGAWGGQHRQMLPLCHQPHDIRSMAALWRRSASTAADNRVTTLSLRPPVTGDRAKRRLLAHGPKRGGASKFLLFYSGHGVLDGHGEFALSLDDSTTVAPAKVLGGGSFPDRSVIFLINACCSGLMSMPKTAGRHYLLAAGNDLVRPTWNPTAGCTKNTRESRLVQALLRGVNSGEADANCDGAVTVLEAARFADGYLALRGDRTEHTVVKADGLGDPVLFHLSPAAKRASAKRCQRWHMVASAVRSCLARSSDPPDAAARGKTPKRHVLPGAACPSLPAPVASALLSALDDQDPPPTTARLWVIGDFGTILGTRLAARFSGRGDLAVVVRRAQRRKRAGPGDADVEDLFRWLPTALSRFAHVVRLSVRPVPGGVSVAADEFVTGHQFEGVVVPSETINRSKINKLADKLLRSAAGRLPVVEALPNVPTANRCAAALDYASEDRARDYLFVQHNAHRGPLPATAELVDEHGRKIMVPLGSGARLPYPCPQRLGHCFAVRRPSAGALAPVGHKPGRGNARQLVTQRRGP